MKMFSWKVVRRFLFTATVWLACQAGYVPHASGIPCPRGGCPLDVRDPPPCTDQCDSQCPPGAGGDFGGTGGNGGGRWGCGNCMEISGAGLGAGHGMPVWWVSEPHINLRLEDEPLSYQPALGGAITFHLSYRQRGAVEEDPAVFGVGTNWSCSFRAYLVNESEYGAQLHRSGAGLIDYSVGYPEPRDGSILSIAGGGTYQIEYADGSLDVFGHPFVDANNVPFYFLTAHVDPAGNTNTFNYASSSSIVQLVSVSDPSGASTYLYYDNASFPNLITRVVDHFSRTCYLQYDSQGFLDSITDVQGLATSFTYNTTNSEQRAWITSMTTPYGPTGFRYGGVDATNLNEATTGDVVNRFVEVTLPTGGKHLFVYRLLSDFLNQWDPTVPSTTPAIVPATWLNELNSFHWSPLQYAALSTSDPTALTAADYKLGRLRHWLWDGYLVTSSLALERAPSPDGVAEGQTTWFDYLDQPYPGYIGSVDQPRLVARVLPDGTSWFHYTPRNSHLKPTSYVSTYTAADGTVALRTLSFSYAANDIDLLQSLGPNGEQVVSNYFAAGNPFHAPDATYDALNQATLYTYNSHGQVTSIKTPAGLTTTNLYFSSGDSLNRLSTTIDLEISRTNTFTYYAIGLLYSQTDERGLTTARTWDNLQRLTGVAYPDGTTTSNLYVNLDLTATKDRLDHWTYYGYNEIRQQTAITNANGVVTRYGYCSCGALYSVTNAWGTPVAQPIYYSYDFQGNRTNTVLPDVTLSSIYDPLGRVTNAFDGWVYRTRVYNSQGLLTTVSNSLCTESSVQFDIEDRPVSATDANGVTVTSVFDDLGRLTSRTYPDTGVESFGYSVFGLSAYTNQIGLSSYYGYDAARRKTSETNANDEVTRFRYDPSGSLTNLIDGKNQSTVWQYDQYGRVTNKLDQAGAVILKYAYDPAGRLTNRWSAAKGDTGYVYDPVGNLTQIHYPSDPTVTLQYDWLNRVTNMVDTAGTTVYTYTTGGQLWTEDGPFASDTVTNTYSNHRRVGFGLQQPSGAWTNAFGYDGAGRLINVTSAAGTFAYLYPSGIQNLISSILLPNTSRITNTYDSVARLLTTKLITSSQTVLDSYAYGYNTANQRTGVTRTDGSTVGYTYDPAGQLTVANSSVNPEDRGYAYDAAGNLRWRTNNGAVSGFLVNNKNELTNAPSPVGEITYDANGNALTNVDGIVYVYDDENRLVAAYDSSSAAAFYTQFVYDGLGRLRRRLEYAPPMIENTNPELETATSPLVLDEPGGGGGISNIWVLTSETDYIYDGKRVIQERDTNSVPLVSYTRGSDLSGTLEGAGGIGGLLGRSAGYWRGSWGSHAYYHADGNGNVTYLADSSQGLGASYRYDPYGNTLSADGPLAATNVYRFSSKELMLNSGLYYYLYRFYDTSLQRWLNRDPIGELGGVNLYGFVANNPVSLTDPYGHISGPVVITIIVITITVIETGHLTHEACHALKVLDDAAFKRAKKCLDNGEKPNPPFRAPYSGFRKFCISVGWYK